MTDLFRDKTDGELHAIAMEFAAAQEQMAANATEDMTHWHHRSLGWLLAELAKRIVERPPDPGLSDSKTNPDVESGIARRKKHNEVNVRSLFRSVPPFTYG